jgi:hypothetical protein
MQSLRNTRTKAEPSPKLPPTAVCLVEDPLSVPTSPSTRPLLPDARHPFLLRYAPTLSFHVECSNSDVSELFNKLNTFDLKFIAMCHVVVKEADLPSKWSLNPVYIYNFSLLLSTKPVVFLLLIIIAFTKLASVFFWV